MRPYLPYLVMAIALALMARRTQVWRRLRPALLPVIPAVVLAAVAFYAWGAKHLGPPVHTLGWLAITGGLAVGLLCGGTIGRLVHLAHDPATGHVTMRMSIAGAVLLVGLLLIRQGARQLGLGQVPASSPAAAFSLVSDVLLAVAVGTVLARQLVLWQRWRGLTRAAVAADAPG